MSKAELHKCGHINLPTLKSDAMGRFSLKMVKDVICIISLLIVISKLPVSDPPSVFCAYGRWDQLVNGIHGLTTVAFDYVDPFWLI